LKPLYFRNKEATSPQTAAIAKIIIGVEPGTSAISGEVIVKNLATTLQIP